MKKQTVLVVDDTPENIHLLFEILQPYYTVIAALNGAKAIQLCEADSKPDLILLDIMMEGMDGYEVCKRLKSDPATSDIPIIFVTAKSQEDDETYGLSF